MWPSQMLIPIGGVLIGIQGLVNGIRSRLVTGRELGESEELRLNGESTLPSSTWIGVY